MVLCKLGNQDRISKNSQYNHCKTHVDITQEMQLWQSSYEPLKSGVIKTYTIEFRNSNSLAEDMVTGEQRHFFKQTQIAKKSTWLNINMCRIRYSHPQRKLETSEVSKTLRPLLKSRYKSYCFEKQGCKTKCRTLNNPMKALKPVNIQKPLKPYVIINLASH